MQVFQGNFTVHLVFFAACYLFSFHPCFLINFPPHYRSIDDATPRQKLEFFLADANNGKATKVTKTALNRLRIDQLRSQLEILGGDTRGNKIDLIKRILDLITSTDAVQTTSSVASDLPEGVISGKQLTRATQLRARAGLTHADFGISEKEFKKGQRAEVSKASDYNRAFASPHDVARMLVEARAEDIAIIDVRGNCSFTDYMVVATGRSSQLVHMLARAVLHELKQRCKEVAPGVAPGIEGADEVDAQWLVVDSGSVVVHIFAEGARKEYNLEGLWGGKNNVTRVATPQRNIQTLHTITA
jgi:ribosome silencing factor RsfS/YbeB/iojap